jgi:hypothetical protein
MMFAWVVIAILGAAFLIAGIGVCFEEIGRYRDHRRMERRRLADRRVLAAHEHEFTKGNR